MSGRAIKLLQGYLWYPAQLPLTLSDWLPQELSGAQLTWDRVEPPFAFFEDGTPSRSQAVLQFTALRVYPLPTSQQELHRDAAALSAALEPLLERLPQGVGWQLAEDLRQV